MQCVTLQTDGTLQTTTQSQQECSSYILLDSSDYSLMVQAYTVTPEQVLAVFSWGFGVVLFFWSLGYAIGAAKMAISKL